jgi:hypothetical protein
MAERQIRRLRTQVKEERVKRLSGRPKKWTPDDDSDLEEERNYSAKDTLQLSDRFGGTSSSSKQFGSTIPVDASFRSTGSTYLVPTNLHTKRSNSASRVSKSLDPGEELEASLLSQNIELGTKQLSNKTLPTADYLKGALWLGRNLVIEVETLVENIETFRNQYLREVTATANDTDIQRACHRLTLLAATRVGEMASAASNEKSKIRKMLHVSS